MKGHEDHVDIYIYIFFFEKLVCLNLVTGIDIQFRVRGLFKTFVEFKGVKKLFKLSWNLKDYTV